MGTPTIPRLAQHVVASVCDVRRARGEMIGVDKTGDMRRRARRGEPIAAIARAVGVSEPTARKYARMDDLSPEPPRRKESESELLAPYEATIDSWLGDDCGNWRKRRHTAARACVRLRDELGYEGSYSTVWRYVRRRREEMARERDRRDAEGFLALSWLPGEVQVDFGEAGLGVRGVLTRGKYPAAAFPHPDAGPAQVFVSANLKMTTFANVSRRMR